MNKSARTNTIYVMYCRPRMQWYVLYSPHIFLCSDGLGQVLTLDPIKEEDSHSSTGKLVPFDSTFSQHIKSPASLLASNLTTLLTLTSPNEKSMKPEQKRLQSVRNLHSTHFGLNSILDGSPDSGSILGTNPKKIRHESLRCFYGSSANSPNRTEVPHSSITVRRSPRFQGM